MKKLLIALLVFVLVVPTVVASGPPPPGQPSPRSPLPPPGGRPPAALGDLDLADRPVPEELAGMELSLEKLGQVREFASSLTDEQRASIGQLLADNPMSVLGKAGDPVPPIQSVEQLRRHAEAMKALLPEMNRWKDAMEAGLAEILTPEQYALFQDSLPPAPVQMADVEPQAQSDCYYAYLYGYYAYNYGYYCYYYAYLLYSSIYGYGIYVSYELYRMAYGVYLYDYYGYVYAYYAYYTYPNHYSYCYYAWLYLLNNYLLAYPTMVLAADIYNMGYSDAYYVYVYAYYAYIYSYYGNYYSEQCCPLY